MARKSIADLAFEVLEENRNPLHYRKITEKIMKIKEIKAENPHHDVNALMGVDQRFIRYQRGIWGLVKWKYREANLPYTLTSYCLHNGTIFLTNYLKPYFAWHRNDEPVQVSFIDSDGEEIRVEVDYQKKLISGFKEWFQKRFLKVNDTILLGLIDKKKKVYFIIAEKDIKYDTEKDMGDKIYQILYNENRALNFSQIFTEITKRELGTGNLFENYILDILNNDIRFSRINNEKWGLLEWLSESEQLFIILSSAENTEDFYNSLKKCFQFLGYNTEYSSGGYAKVLIAQAELASKSYSLLITGLPKNYDINTIHSIDWQMLKKIKQNQGADTTILFSEKILLPELIDRASEEGVQLYELSILEYIINEHKQIPFSLIELRTAFSPLRHPGDNLIKLQKIRESQWQDYLLLKIIINTLQVVRTKNTFIDLNLLTQKINLMHNSFHNNKIESAQVKKALTLLSKEPFKLLELSESGNIILAFPDHLAQEKIYNTFQYILENKDI